MKIRRINVYQVSLPLCEGCYNWSGGKSVSLFDSSIIEVSTTDGVVGYGEVCPLGPSYLPAYARGVRAGIAEIAPHLIGCDPCELEKLNRRMDELLQGHPYVKSGIDVACWDILGQVCGQPLCALLGGRYGEDYALYRAISQESPEKMAAKVAAYRAEGYSRFQLKVGGHPDEDVQRIRAASQQLKTGDTLIADANTGWLMHQAVRVVNAVGDVDVYIEQPCISYEECLSVRRRSRHPFILDETIDNLDILLRSRADMAVDIVNIKISKFGGLTKSRQARDLCARLGIAMIIEDSWGSDLATASIAHLAHSTPTELLFTSTDFNSYTTVSTANGAPQRNQGRMKAPHKPGLGITPKLDALGKPVLSIPA